MAENKEGETKRERDRGRKAFWTVVVVAGLVATAHYGFGSLRNHHRGWHRMHSPSNVKEILEKKAERVLKKVDATSEQRAKVNEIIGDLVPDIVGFQKEREELKIRIVRALERGETHAEDIEQARASSVRLAEKAINRSFEAFLAVSGVLTPEQRKELLKEWNPRG